MDSASDNKKLSAVLLSAAVLILTAASFLVVESDWLVMAVTLFLLASCCCIIGLGFLSDSCQMKVNAEKIALLVETSAFPAEDCCSICYDDNPVGIIRTPCTHVFHRTCIQHWVEVKNSCPLCKKQIVYV